MTTVANKTPEAEQRNLMVDWAKLNHKYKTSGVLLALVVSGCGGLMFRGDAVQDCITVHLRTIAKGGLITQQFYSEVVEACRQAHGGRP